MANLISKKEHTTRRHEVLGRVMLVLSLAVLITSVSAILAMLPRYFDFSAERITREVELLPLDQAEDGEMSDRDTLINARKRTNALERIGKPKQLVNSLVHLVNQSPEGVSIRSIVYSKKDGMGTLSVSGIIVDSDAFKDYAEILKGWEFFQKVEIPITSLANTEGGKFSINIIGNF